MWKGLGLAACLPAGCRNLSSTSVVHGLAYLMPTSSPANCQCYISSFHPLVGTLNFPLESLPWSQLALHLVSAYVHIFRLLVLLHDIEEFYVLNSSNFRLAIQGRAVIYSGCKVKQRCFWFISKVRGGLRWLVLLQQEIGTYWRSLARTASRWEVLLVLMPRRGIDWIELCKLLLSSLPPSCKLSC